jgi:hypothetical protein
MRIAREWKLQEPHASVSLRGSGRRRLAAERVERQVAMNGTT